MTDLVPFADEETSVGIDDLTVENRTDRVSLYGSLEITRDRAGLERARRLQALLDRVVAVLRAEDEALPARIAEEPGDEVDNPFA